MADRFAGAAVGALLVLSGSTATAQPAGCTSPPAMPTGVEATLIPARDALVPDTAPLPAVLRLAWETPGQDESGRLPTRYVIEAGSVSGATDVAVDETPGTIPRYSVPLPNGTFHVRVRSRNECGDSPASDEFQVRVTDSVRRDLPNPVVLLDTVNAVREGLAGTFFVRVMGEVRNGWLAAPASFIEVTALFDGPAGMASEPATTFVAGQGRRLAQSRLITDTALGPGDTGCFVAFAQFPDFEVTGVRLGTSAESFDLEPPVGNVEIRTISQAPDEFGDLTVSGTVTNVGDTTAYSTEVRLAVLESDGRVSDCDVATVDSGPDNAADTLSPGTQAAFGTGTETIFAEGRQIRAWPTWHDTVAEAPGATEQYLSLQRALRQQMRADEDATSPQARAIARDALRREALTIERQH